MKLYNSKINQIEAFEPIESGKVSMYVCGPTVYNQAHIGNARPIVVFDLLRRVLVAGGYEVMMVSNFTDVDDRIIQKAKEENVPESVITERYIDAYNKVRTGLHAEGINATPRVTETMDGIIAFIENLVAQDFAYEVNGDVYFRVHKIKDYGEISSQNIDDLLVGARIEANTAKENPLDFALWKNTDDDGIKWDSPWGRGRPGWHTECVVMINDEFKMELIDIHGGGQDLKFPHHENESAQSKALHNHDLANYWVHNAMLNLDGVKMSKSLGNVMWAQDYIDALGSNLTRWLLLSTHYRLVLNMTDELIEQARTELTKVSQAYSKAVITLQREQAEIGHVFDAETYTSFMAALNDDLNVANANVFLFETVKRLNQLLRIKDVDVEAVSQLVVTMEMMLNVLGIVLERVVLTDADRATFDAWEQAKLDKDFERADVYRKTLSEKGLI
ncbi:cysteine--tRNA ligase [Erysipelothrix sp. HDW6C]|uniref:cysteine--tRNA ligase n=1 Tax=Erysipelothrix sp. HDW6C TaxID=2714930 RepID=UPI00140CC258|nr:cysteine--tRNA ligase [Erysipelothrix sp. HDW6C]QIK68866.1 cysteine--tRNA ligase [Erysipelothrix sp. HDW6C]